MRIHKIHTSAITAAAALFAGLFLAVGCQSENPGPAGTTVPAASVAGKSGSQLWSENCQRCHNMRSPETYSHAQWDMIVHHMRQRANITGQEQRAIADFLKAGG